MTVKNDAVTSKKVRPGKKAADEVFTGETDPEANESDLMEMVREAEAERASENIAAYTPPEDGRVLVKMERSNASWTTSGGVKFDKKHPFQLVNEQDLFEVLNSGGFRRCDPQEMVAFYTT